MYVKTYQIVHFKYVQLITRKLYLNKALKMAQGKKQKFVCPTLWEICLATLC